MTAQQLYRLRYPDRVIASKERWRKAHPEVHAAHSKAWRDRNPDKAKETYTEWAKRNPESIYLKTKRRRALLKGVEHQPYDRMEIYLDHNGICSLCGQLIDMTFRSPDPRSLTLDHIKPLSQGGNDTKDNLAPAHYGCNSRKGNRI